MSERIWTFPASLQFKGAVFHVPGSFFDGGITAGGARVMSPEPGGFSRLVAVPTLSTDEWGSPDASWVMSKVNGQIFEVRLPLTPQIATASLVNGIYVESGATRTFAVNALEGATVVFVDFGGLGRILQNGHVIGHDKHCYMVDEIIYDVDDDAEIHITPPLRKNITAGQPLLFRPWFIGYIANGSEMITTYDAENAGHIEIPRIIFNEVIPL